MILKFAIGFVIKKEEFSNFQNVISVNKFVKKTDPSEVDFFEGTAIFC